MDKVIRKVHPPALKAKVALEAIKGEKTVAELSSIYGVHSTQIKQWKQIAMENIEGMFSDKRKQREKEGDELIEQLYQQIGKLKVEADWLKKKIGLIER